MKKNSKGFVLLETLVVSVFILSTLLFLYIQANNINRSYNESFSYNTVQEVYLLKSFKEYLLSNGYHELVTKIEEEKLAYINITDCPILYLTNDEICVELKNDSNINQLLIAKESYLYTDSADESISFGFKTYIEKLNFKKTSNKYVIIGEFKNNTYSYIRMN